MKRQQKTALNARTEQFITANRQDVKTGE